MSRTTLKSFGRTCLALGLLVAALALPSHATAATLFQDNFNTADNASFDAASTAGRLSGSLATETVLRSWGSQQQINSNELLIPSGGQTGVRFEKCLLPSSRYDWAGGSASASILAAGGFSVSFDWTPVNNTSTDWVAWQAGTPNGDSGVNAAGVDYGILFRNNGATERWDNGANQGAGGSFTANAGGVTRAVNLDFSFNSFADGASVNVFSTVDGTPVANDNFMWDGNAGAMLMELGNNAANTRVDDLTISTPTVATIAPESIGLFNTGVETTAGFDADTNGGIAGDIDDHWYITGGPPGELQTNGPEAWVLQDPPGSWLSNASSPDSVWISGRAAAQGIALGGDYPYLVDFDISGFNPNAVTIEGRFAVDNSAVVSLNGAATGISGAGFETWVPFVLNSGFAPGANTLEFLVNNAGTGPMGLRVEFTSLTGFAIPEPSTFALLLGGIGMLAMFRRRRS